MNNTLNQKVADIIKLRDEALEQIDVEINEYKQRIKELEQFRLQFTAQVPNTPRKQRRTSGGHGSQLVLDIATRLIQASPDKQTTSYAVRKQSATEVGLTNDTVQVYLTTLVKNGSLARPTHGILALPHKSEQQ